MVKHHYERDFYLIKGGVLGKGNLNMLSTSYIRSHSPQWEQFSLKETLNYRSHQLSGW